MNNLGENLKDNGIAYTSFMMASEQEPLANSSDMRQGAQDKKTVHYSRKNKKRF